ncbi:MAG: hypothetical protein H6Q49_71 [Deltaproteobacteria bacterium]|nr:hypothetical protein [Deltaproteobacteria bacterium]
MSIQCIHQHQINPLGQGSADGMSIIGWRMKYHKSNVKVALFGTCRIAFTRNHFSCTDFDNAISFVHTTKEILQLFRFISRQIEIPDSVNRYCFRTSLLNRQPVAHSSVFLEQFREADLFVIEICSVTKYLYQGYYMHHLATDRRHEFYKQTPEQIIRETVVSYQDRREIEQDISEIMDFIHPRKMLIVSHVNAPVTADYPAGKGKDVMSRIRSRFPFAANAPHDDLSTQVPVNIGRRAALIDLLRAVSQEKGIPFLDPSVLLKRYRLKRILQVEKSGLPISHYTDFGGKVAGRLYAEEIKKIMGLP